MKNKYSLAIQGCKEYRKDEIKQVLQRCFSLIGGLEKFIEKGKSICIKPNILMPSSPGQAIITHPVFIEAVVELILERTGEPENIVVADSFSPVVPFTKKGIDKVYKETGIDEISKRTGCRLNYSTEYTTLSNPKGKFLKKIEVIQSVIESDIIINLPKFKTHGLTGITGAVKNMFGVVPGFTKVGYHLRFEDLIDFAGMLLDLVGLVKPALNIMDGILGLEGDGPGRSGTPRKIGLVVVSDDAMAMDMVIGKLSGLAEELNPFLEAYNKRQENGFDWDDVMIMGKDLQKTIIDGFELPRTVGQKKLIQNSFISRHIMPFARNALNPYPGVDSQKCDGCMTCKDICPRKIIEYNGRKVIVDRAKCIRCFCCSEMCPKGALEPRYSFIADFTLNRMGFGGKKK